MATTVNVLAVRKSLGRDLWKPPEPFGPDGWSLTASDRSASVILTVADHDGVEWIHASIARDVMPSYEDLTRLHAAVWGGHGWAYQVFAPASDHVNIHEHALHLWGRVDGQRVLPDFTHGSGSI